MDLSPTNCYDCPAPLILLFGYYAVFAAALILAGRLHRKSRESHRTLGSLIATLTFLFAASMTKVVPSWGISKTWDPLESSFTDGQIWAILLALDAALIVVFLVARRASRP